MSTAPSFPNFQPDPEKQKRRGRQPAAKIETVKIADIISTSAIQSRSSLTPSVWAEYMERKQAGDVFPPPVVFRDPKTGNLYLADGKHRITADTKLGRDEIEVSVRPGTERDAWMFSLSANADHGLPRSNEDKRRAVEKALSDPEIRKWCNNSIAKLCRVSNSMVGSMRSHLGLQEPPGATRTRVTHTPDGKPKEIVVSGPKLRPTAKAMESPSFFKGTPEPQTKTTATPMQALKKILKDEKVEDLEENKIVVLGVIPLYSAKERTMWWVMPEFTPHGVCEAVGRMLALRACLRSAKAIEIVIVGRDNSSGRPWVNYLADLLPISVTFRTLNG